MPQEAGSEYLAIYKISQVYPDVEVIYLDNNPDAWIACSREANADMTDIAIDSDEVDGVARWWIWCSLVLDGERVYADPPYFMLGTENAKGFGIVPARTFDEFKNVLNGCNLPSSIYDRICDFLNDRPQIDYLD